MWSTKPHSQREQITGGVLCCYTATEKLDYLLKQRHSRGSYRKGSGNKETQSSNMPREISGSNNILKPWFMGKRKKMYQSEPRKIIVLHIFSYWIFAFLTTCLRSVIPKSFCEPENWPPETSKPVFSSQNVEEYFLPWLSWCTPEHNIRVILFWEALKALVTQGAFSLLQIGVSSGFLGWEGNKAGRHLFVCFLTFIRTEETLEIKWELQGAHFNLVWRISLQLLIIKKDSANVIKC